MGGSHWRRVPYPSQASFLRRHSLQRGWVSSHLVFRSRHVQHPVNVLVRFFDGAARAELADICAPEIGLFRCDIGRSSIKQLSTREDYEDFEMRVKATQGERRECGRKEQAIHALNVMQYCAVAFHLQCKAKLERRRPMYWPISR